MTTGFLCSSSRMPCSSHQLKNSAMACAYAARVFLFRMLAVKNSTKRQPARSPARVIAAGSCSKPALRRWRRGGGTGASGSIGFLGVAASSAGVDLFELTLESADALARHDEESG